MAQTLNLKIFRSGTLVDQKTITQDVIKIGKLKSSHLCLEDDSVARMHAVIEVSGGDVRVIDLGSSTGTLLNNRRVEKNAVLQHGNILQFGPFQLQVEFVHGATAPSPRAGGAIAPASVVAEGVGVRAAAGHPAGGAVSATGSMVGQRPLVPLDTSEVEVHDGRAVAEVMAVVGTTVFDVQHVGQVKSRRSSAPLFLGIGGVMMLVGVGVLAFEVSHDWDAHQIAVQEAADAGRPAPQAPGYGLGGFGLALALLGLVPIGLGLIRLQDVGLSSYTIGEGHDTAFPASAQGLPRSDAFALVSRGVHGDSTLNFTDTMAGDVTLGGETLSLGELVTSGRASSAGSSHAFPIPTGARCRVSHQGLAFHVNSVPPGRLIAQKSETDKPFWFYSAASLFVLGTLLVMTHLIPDDALNMNLDDDLAANRFVGYMNQPDELPEEEPPPEQENANEEAGGSGERHAGESGKMGKPSSKTKSGLYAMKGPADAIPQMARDFDPDMQARQSGILGMIQAESGHFLASPYGEAFAVGNDDEDVWGGLTGTDIGEAFGVGGLGLVGTGRGGGGTGEGTIGLGNVGLIGKGGGGGSGSGYGRGSGSGFGGRGKRVPRVRQAKATVKGAIDKDIIRRIVRNHLNEVRACYQQGLVRDPNLQGRVAVQFTIGPSGKVPLAVVQDASIKDRNVANCIAKAVRRWKFPKPRGGGNVVVTYPFRLDPG